MGRKAALTAFLLLGRWKKGSAVPAQLKPRRLSWPRIGLFALGYAFSAFVIAAVAVGPKIGLIVGAIGLILSSLPALALRSGTG